ncbi:MAG: TIGR04282 family arsenosugar biosynthesis glycosyltransferase [Xanthobacteraceae bacterium]|nr:TIGR04282 family arsenosugar biosynthesis glycosyltransferase [Xanthobacteraceae bacterium]
MSAESGCGIAIMAKASIPGRAKTRLVPPLTFAEAADFNTAFLKDVVANIAAAAREAPIRGYAAYGPPETVAFFTSTLMSSVGLIEAWHPNFGDCLLTAIEAMFDRGHSAAVVLNSDSPTLPTALLTETARLLACAGDCAVLGPSRDGGYYLLGLKTPYRRLFEDVAWSTEQVAEQTRARAAEIGLPVHVLPEWYDVDDAQSLQLLRSELDGVAIVDPDLQPHTAVHSSALIRRLLDQTDLAMRLEIACTPALQRAAE